MTMDMPARMTPLEVSVKGPDLLRDPLLNKGTAFSESERDAFDLHGLLPPHLGTLEGQIDRRLKAFRAEQTPMSRSTSSSASCRIRTRPSSMRSSATISKRCCPIVYTPTVGRGLRALQPASTAQPRGLFISYAEARPTSTQILAYGAARSRRRGASSSVTASAFSASATRGRAGWASRSASSRSTPRCGGIHPARPRCRSCSTSAPTTSERLERSALHRLAARARAWAGIRRLRRGFRQRCDRPLAERARCNGRTSHGRTPIACSSATAIGSARSTTTSRAPRRSPPVRCSRRSTSPAARLRDQRDRHLRGRHGRHRDRRRCSSPPW